jgi:hypothetical protein
VASASNLVNTIAGPLTVDGGSGGSTSLAVVATGTAAGRTVGLDGQTITGLDLPGSITYAHLSQFSLALGAGNDTVNVNLTAAGAGETDIDTGAGSDTVNITGTQGLTDVTGGAGDDRFNVSGFGGNVTLDGGAGADVLNLTLAGAPSADQSAPAVTSEAIETVWGVASNESGRDSAAQGG